MGITELPHDQAEQLRSFDIHLGVPLQFPEDGPNTIKVPSMPHVFYCTDLFLIQPIDSMVRTQNLPVVLIPFEDKTVSAIHLTGVMVMLGHADTSGRRDEAWKFVGTHQAVSDTVIAYQNVASDVLWPPLDAVIACRPVHPSTSTHERGVTLTFNRTMIPIIRPDSSAHVRSDGIYQSELKPGFGSTLFVAADTWDDVHWWFNYWSYFPRFNTIPQWAREPTR